MRIHRVGITTFCLFLLAAGAAVAQAVPAQTQSQIGPGGRRAGDQCDRRTDRAQGVVKVDACGRWYCGRIDVNDITVLNPRFAQDMKCTWKLVDDKCKCSRS